MHDAVAAVSQFIDLSLWTVVYLFAMGFVGGLVSGFIGSGGAFVLTPGMMSLGVPGLMAVASNMCHKFPKALVGAMKRAKYGQVDVKLGVVLGVSAEAGVLYGASIQEGIKKAYGDAGSNLYVSTAFVLVSASSAASVLRDAIKSYRAGTRTTRRTPRRSPLGAVGNIPTRWSTSRASTRGSGALHDPPRLRDRHARRDDRGRRLRRRAPMMYVLGAPGLMASAPSWSSLVMGVGGTFKYALHGMVDIRLALIILAGSLFGIQLGAIGTTYVRPYMIKLVMGVIMVTVLFSRLLMLPVYMSQLHMIGEMAATGKMLSNTSWDRDVRARLGAFIVLKAMWRRQARRHCARAPARWRPKI
jgi:hypothetical protein